MFKALFDIILNLVATLVQAVLFPINSLITAVFPNFSSTLISVSQGLGTLFNGITWGLGVLPTPIIAALSFMILVEISKVTIYSGTHAVIKLWNLIQKLKFW